MEVDVCLAVPAEREILEACAASIRRAVGQGQRVNVFPMLCSKMHTEQAREMAAAILPEAVPIFSDSPATMRNIAAQQGKADWILFLDGNLRLCDDFFAELALGLQEHPEAGGFLCRQMPWQGVPHVNPVTLETAVLHNSLCVVRRQAFARIGGFDSRIPAPMAQDDFCLRLRGQGQALFYLPRACALGDEAQPPAILEDYVDETVAPLLFAQKHGRWPDMHRAGRQYRAVLKAPRHYPNVRKALLKRYLLHFIQMWPLRLGQAARHNANGPEASYSQYPVASRGNSALPRRFNAPSGIGVAVRTSGRPQLLRGALESLCKQTLPPARVVVVEDGPPLGAEVARIYAEKLPLEYVCTEKKVGRARAGNLGLEKLQTPYLNFLDDDDYFYPEHIEEMSYYAALYPDADLLLGCATAAWRKPDKPLSGVEAGDRVEYMLFERINPFTMSQMCQIPIQSGVFKRALFQRCGGLEESLEADEDWAMWLRFLAVGKRVNPNGADNCFATSAFTVPAGSSAAQIRLAQYGVWDRKLFRELDIPFQLNQADLRRFYAEMIDDMRHLEARGELGAYLQRQFLRDSHWEAGPSAAKEEEKNGGR